MRLPEPEAQRLPQWQLSQCFCFQLAAEESRAADGVIRLTAVAPVSADLIAETLPSLRGKNTSLN